jgi:catechol-2,3-dioxygenase
MTFVNSSDTVDGRPPFYHFAFNIPENKILKALEWQKARTPMLYIPESNRATGYPPEVVDYSHWNAHSVFFLDPAGNVVEYIARHDLKNGDSSPFSWGDILYASEIGLIVNDVAATAAMLTDVTGVSQYKGGNDQFMAMGDEYGLLLVMKRGRVVDFTSNPHNGVRVYRTAVAVRGPKTTRYEFADYPYQLGVEERCSCA